MEQIKTNTQKITGAAKALLAAGILSAACLALLALLLWKMNLSEGQVRAAVIGIYLLSCFVGGRIAGAAAGTRKFLWGLLTGAGYFLVLFLLSALCLPGGMAGAGTVLAALGLCTGGGMAGGMSA